MANRKRPNLCQHLEQHHAVVLQHGSSFTLTASAAPKQPAMWHNISLASIPSYTPWAMLQDVKGLFSSQPFTSSAAQGQGTGSNAISGSAGLPSQAHASAQGAESQRRANSCHQRHVSGRTLLLLSFYHMPDMLKCG